MNEIAKAFLNSTTLISPSLRCWFFVLSVSVGLMACDSAGPGDPTETDEVRLLRDGEVVDGVMVSVGPATTGVEFTVNYENERGQDRSYVTRDSLDIVVQARRCSDFSIDWVVVGDSTVALKARFGAIVWWDRLLVLETGNQVPRFPDVAGTFDVSPPALHNCSSQPDP